MKKSFLLDVIEREQAVGQILIPNHEGGPSHIKYAKADITWMRGEQKVIINIKDVYKEIYIHRTRLIKQFQFLKYFFFNASIKSYSLKYKLE